MTIELIDCEGSASGAALRRYRHPRRGVVEVLTAGSIIYLRTPRAVPHWRELVDQVLGRSTEPSGRGKRRIGKQMEATS